MTIIEIIDNKILIDGETSPVLVSDFDLDSSVRVCSLSGTKRVSSPILRKMFKDTVVHSNIKIVSNKCIYSIRRVIVYLLSMSSKIRVRMSLISTETVNSTFYKIDHECLLRLRYIILFESLLNRIFRSRLDFLDYCLCDYCYYNIILSKSPSCDDYESFIDYFDDILDVKILTEKCYVDLFKRVDKYSLVEFDGVVSFPSKIAIDKHGWISGEFHEYFCSLSSLISNNMNIKINNNLMGFDPSIDVNFQDIISESLLH